MTAREMIETLGRLDPDAEVVIMLDNADVGRGDGIYVPMILLDDGDGVIVINIADRAHVWVGGKVNR